MSEVKDVYFIEAVGTDRVKIGRAWNPNQRRRELQTSSPHELKLLGVVFGKRHSEPELHERFEKYRILGEWFRLSAIRVEMDAILEEEERIDALEKHYEEEIMAREAWEIENPGQWPWPD